MTTETKAPGAGKTSETPPSQDQVSKADFETMVKKSKDLEAKLAEYTTREKEKEKQDLEKQGNLKGLVETLRAESKAKEDALKAKEMKFAATSLHSKVSEYLKEKGCSHVDDAIKLIPQSDMKEIQMNADDYSANIDDIKRVVSKLEKEKSYLFQKNFKITDGFAGGSKVNGGAKTEVPMKDGKPDLNAMRNRIRQGIERGEIDFQKVTN